MRRANEKQVTAYLQSLPKCLRFRVERYRGYAVNMETATIEDYYAGERLATRIVFPHGFAKNEVYINA